MLSVQCGVKKKDLNKKKLPSRNIASLHPHPKYDPRQYAFDIMVIKTVSPFQLGRTVNTIKLADQGYDPAGNV